MAEVMLGRQSFDIDYRMSSEDYLAYLRYQEESPRSLWIQSLHRIAALVVGFPCLVLHLVFREGYGWLVAGVLAVIMHLFAARYYSHSVKVARRRRFRGIKAKLEKELEAKPNRTSRLQLGSTGIVVIHDEQRAEIPWESMLDLGVTARHLFLRHDNNLIVISRRHFPDHGTFRQFTRCAEEYHEQSRRTSATRAL